MATTPKKKRPKPASKNPKPKRPATRTSWKKGQSPSPETQVKPGQVLNPNGKPSYYKPEFVEMARKMCALGATDRELADVFGVAESTVRRWQVVHEEFAEAVKVGKEGYDDRVERALAMRAMGYEQEVEKVFCFQGQIVKATTREHVAADVAAAKHWLAIRRKETWDRPDKLEMTGRDGGPIETESRSDLEIARRIAFALAKADREREDKTIEHDGSA